MLKLAIVSTHPIQYYAPVFQSLARAGEVLPRVFYTWSQAEAGAQFDPGFGRVVQWDVPLLEGYEYEFVPNVAREPGTERFLGLQNPTLNARIEAWGADAVLVYAWNSHSHLAALRHFKGRIPVFFRGDSTLLDAVSGMRRLARRAFLHWVYRHVDVALAVGENNRDYFAWCGLAPSSIRIVPHTIDAPRFQRDGDAREAAATTWRQSLGIPDDDVVLLFAAKLVPKKAPLLLLEAFKRLHGRAHLVIAGSGEQEDALRAAATVPRVHFLPFQNQDAMPTLYRLGDLLVLPSLYQETWGLALNEAMACNRAVLASDRVGAARDVIAEGATGWTVPAGDVAALAAALERAVAAGRGRLRQMGEAGGRRADRWSTAAAAAGIAAAVSHGCHAPDG